MIHFKSLIEIISGQRRGFVAAVTRGGLSLLTPVYRLGIGWRNWQFDRAQKRTKNSRIKFATIPVISIGNLTTGGTGKTPLVIWLARYLRSLDLRVAVVSRGYGAVPSAGGHQSRNDEALELEFRLPDVPHLQSPDRWRMVQTAVEELESQVAILDDGSQHRQLHRDFDLVVIDATNPFGYDRLLPRGLLREPISSLRRADSIVLTRCELVDDSARSKIITRIQRHAPNLPIAQVRTRARGWLQFDEQRFPLEKLTGKPIFAFCGIGNTAGFFATLEQHALDVRGQFSFPDHHPFSRIDLENIAKAARNCGATALVCTHKDLVKVCCNQLTGLPVYALQIELEFLWGQTELESQILQMLERWNDKNPSSSS